VSLRHLFRPAALALIAWAIVVFLMLALESSFLYFPSRTLDARPRDYGLDADEVRLTADDGVGLHGWWLHGRGARVLVWFHGNAGNISHRLDNAKRLIDRFGLDILLVDYRGYGLSEGRPSEAGLYRDGLAMYDEAVRRGFGPARIVLFGRSLGAAVAVEVGLQRRSAAMILETPFRSVPAMARAHYPFIPAVLIRSRFDVEAKIAAVEVPKLILHGDRDEIVPLAHAQRIFDLARPPKRIHLIRGAGHNDTYLVGGEEYFRAWREFLEEI
jgi:fermentation-respiration switch protein FrsA (DUF1100 family)